MKKLNFISPLIYVSQAKNRGRGVYAAEAIPEETVIEIAPVIVMSAADRKLMDQSVLHNYIFEWGETKKQCCMALGYISLYNHSYQSNCEYEMDFRKELITIRTVKAIAADEELFINYNGEPVNDTPVWFDVE